MIWPGRARAPAGRCCALLATAAILAAHDFALAESATLRRAVLIIPHCERPPFSREQLSNALAIELRQEGVEEIAERADQDAAVVEIRHDCGAPLTVAVVRIFDRRSSMTRVVDVGDIETRSIPRALALVAAELARSMWARPASVTGSSGWSAIAEPEERRSPTSAGGPGDLATDASFGAVIGGRSPPRSPLRRQPPQPKESGRAESEGARSAALDKAPSQAESARADPPPATVADRRPGAVAVLARGQASVYVQHPTTLWGGGLVVGLGRARAGVQALTSVDRDILGQVRFTVVAGEASIEFASNPAKRFQWRAAPRLVAGQVRAVADSTSGAEAGSSSDVYLEGGMELGLAATIASGLRLELSAALAYALGSSAKADERVVGVVAGPCASLSLALGVDLTRR